MPQKIDKHMIEELKENVKAKKPGEPVEEILATFCQRNGLSLNDCRVYYKRLVKEGKIKET